MSSQMPAALLLASSTAAAACTGACFLALGLLAGFSFYLCRFKTYILLAASGILRGVGLILRARAIQTRDADMLAAWQALSAAGFGMAIGVVSLIGVSWYRNAALWGEPPARSAFARSAAQLCLLTVPAVITCGPLLGAVAAGLLYGGGGGAALSAAMAVKQASSWGMFAIIMLMTVMITVACMAAVRRALEAARQQQQQQQAGSKAAPSSALGSSDLLVLLVLPAALALDVAAAQRGAATLDPYFLSDTVFYPMAVMPELINLLLLSLVPCLVARIGMCGHYRQHLKAVGRLPEPQDGAC